MLAGGSNLCRSFTKDIGAHSVLLLYKLKIKQAKQNLFFYATFKKNKKKGIFYFKRGEINRMNFLEIKTDHIREYTLHFVLCCGHEANL